MRFYGRNQARLLGEDTEEQPMEKSAPESYRCSRCGRDLPTKMFNDGMYLTCETCRAADARRRKLIKERTGR